MSLIKYFKTDFANQRLLLGFGAILACQGLPEEILAFTPQILKHSIAVTSEIIKLREEEEFEDDDEEDDEHEEDQQTTMKKLANAVEGNEPEEEDDEDFDMDEDFDPLDKYHYNYSYECPLENVDEIIVFE